MTLPYDESDPISIEAYAKRLTGRTLSDLLGSDVQQSYRGKGRLGQLLEKEYFQYEPNSEARPDFPKAGVELKTTPLKTVKDKLVSKERLVFNLINFEEEAKATFETSSFWAKNRLLLLMFYLHDAGKIDIDLIFKICRLWEFPPEDLKIIRDDWEKIVSKIRAGLAHQLSEGDTLYLGACTKGQTAESSYTTQPYSTDRAKARAFSLKSKYLNFIVDDSLQKESEAVISNSDDYRLGQTFEEFVIERFAPFYGKSEAELMRDLGLPASEAKSKFYVIAKSILGVTAEKVQEFEKANVEMKTVRLEENGTLKESMSFKQIQFNEIIDEIWDESYWLKTLTKRFFFVVFQKDEYGEFRLLKVKFWAMPVDDLEVAREFWEDTKSKIIKDDFQHFIKQSDNRICFVRTKARDSYDLMPTNSGRMEKKLGYWLDSGYIKKIVDSA